ncbi:MAG: UV DNA damage repair endonuclease UvsE [Planctomycetaceae bacterium]|nr:UV DNA damage repair endonuclease UvsE [Planctomycetaceae bacterium]
MRSIGYACKIYGPPGWTLRSLTLKTASRDRLVEVTKENLATLRKIFGYNTDVGVRLFRISSDVVPLATHPEAMFDWRRECRAELDETAAALARSGQRVSMHPGQYTVLNSPDAGVAERSVADLVYHASFLDAIGAPEDARIVLHVGGKYGNAAAAVGRFRQRYKKLPKAVRRRLVLENDEHNFAIDVVIGLCRELGCPAIMDVFHHSINPAPEGDEADWLREAAATWRGVAGMPKIHYSQQLRGGRPGMHSQTITAREFVRWYKTLPDILFDIMLEVKDKNRSALKCIYSVQKSLPRARLTEKWARYKYSVLERSPSHYRRIREYLKADKPQALGFYDLLEEAMAAEITAGHAVTAVEHVWGYVKNQATEAERRRYEKGVAALRTSTNALPGLKKSLGRLAEKYGQEYLVNSMYFTL